MSEPNTTDVQPGHPFTSQSNLILSLVSVVLGSLILRAAAGAMGENIQFYFNAIHEAASNPNHPLRVIAGEKNVYPISYTLGGIIIVTFFASELAGSLLLGAWSDRYGRKLFIILGPLFGALAVQITALTTVVWLLIVTRLLEGLSTAANAPATLGYIAEATAHSSRLRSRVSGLYEVGTIGGVGLGFVLGGWLWRNFGTAALVAGIPLTSPAFALNALVYVASFIVLWLGIHDVREKRNLTAAVDTPRQTLARYWRIVRSPRVAEFAPAWIAINGVLGIWINLSARMLTDKSGPANQLLSGHFDSFQAGNLRAAFAVVLTISILIWSVGFSGLKKTAVMLIGTGGLFVTCLMLFALNHQPALGAPLVIPLVGGLVLSILVMGGFTPAALAHLADLTEDYTSDRGAIMGLYSVFLGLGQFLGVALGGPFVDWLGADGIVVSSALLGVVAAGILVHLHILENRRSTLGVQAQAQAFIE